MHVYTILPLFINVLTRINGARILGIYPYAWGSHYILGIKLMNGLAEAGHDITYVTPYPTKTIPATYNWTDVVLEGQVEAQTYFKNQVIDGDGLTLKMLKVVSLWSENMTRAVLTNPKIKEFIQSGETFDAIIADQAYGLDCLNVLSYLLNAPLITVSSVGALGMAGDKVLNPKPISTSPSMGHYIPELTQTLSFSARLKNLIIRFMELLVIGYNLKFQPTLLKELFPDSPSFHDVYLNVSLVLLNSHPSIMPAGPLVPNMIEVGGYHIESPKPLSSELQKFLDDAKDGVVYFSMGSEINSKKLLEDKQREYLQVFAGLKQRVLWKFDQDIPGKPHNVLIQKWVPQQDILGHPNVKLFIMQGGLLSITESIYNGKPILCIPCAADQIMNCHVATQAGYSLQLDFKDIRRDKLKILIEELLQNPQYTNAAKKVSTIYHDRPMTPLQTAIYWVEYAIRHKGAPHLRVAGVGMPLYKYHMIDVLVVVVGGVLLALIAAKWLVQFLVTRIIKLKTEKVKTS